MDSNLNNYLLTEKILISVLYKTYPTVTSKMLLPTEEDTAMSPNPFLATMTLVMRSGMDVPAARNVRPITCKIKYLCKQFIILQSQVLHLQLDRFGI